MTTQYGNVTDTSGYTQAFYSAYKAGYEHVLQESREVYAGRTRVDTIEGERKAYDFLGTIDLTEKTTRFGDVPIEEIDHNRRWISPRWFHKGVYIDDLDKIALLADPTSDYIQALAKGAIRTKNDVVYGCFEASVYGGKDYGDDTYAFNDAVCAPTTSEGGRTIVHDATKAFAVGGTSSGLTIEKLILAREALTTLKNDPNQVFNIVCSHRQLSDLLHEAETQSIDTSIVKSLVAGAINEYMGFRFIVDYNIVIGSSNDIDADTNIYPCYAFTNDAILVAQHVAPSFKVDWLPAKQIWQIYGKIGTCAARMDEDKVIKIECAAV
ncbi:MAG: hypothetical protein IMZ53_13440 [Thermoplasmata archaeon]|nr:hypothetical protein [Thermoplasmata archaeon]